MKDEVLLVKREPTNSKDRNAVAIYQDNIVVGHVPFNLAASLSNFLKRDVNKAFVTVVGEKVNRRAGFGLELPCVYRLYGPKAYIDKMKELVHSLSSSGLL